MSEILTVNSIVYGAVGFGAGYFIGWFIKKLAKIIFKLSLVALTLFVTALVYLESIKVIHLDERALDNLMNSTYSAINTAIQQHNIDTSPTQFIFTTIGIPLSFGIGTGFLYGFYKG